MESSSKTAMRCTEVLATLLLSASTLAFTPVSALAQVTQCQPPSPNPPAAKIITNTPNTAVVLRNSGAAGCQGDADGERNGGRGQPAGTSTQTSKTPAGTPTQTHIGGVAAISDGGNGGSGANIEYQSGQLFPDVKGGFAGGGGPAGAAKLTFDGAITASVQGAALRARANGGSGGNGGKAISDALGSATGQAGGAGASGGIAILNAQTAIAKSAPLDAISVQVGGNGGNGGNAGFATGSARVYSGPGGNGGIGGTATAIIDGLETAGKPSTLQGSVIVRATGGAGGNAATAAGGFTGKAREGGSGGIGGTASLTIGANALVDVVSSAAKKDGHAGVWVFANGGVGGEGGDARAVKGDAGGGGLGGAGGAASLTLNGGIKTKGDHLHGGLVQSIGGAGANGGSVTSLFYAKGAPAGYGGDAGKVSVTTGNGAEVRVIGKSSFGLKVQSIGGGGGSGGDATAISAFGAAVALGGNGGIGGKGNAVDITLGQAQSNPNQSTFISSLSKVSGGGVLAQSIGGAGGSGGSAAAYGGGTVNLAIGNQGAAGAAAGTVSVVNNAAVITTYGDHATGIDAQSVGGGGGKGGSAFSGGVSEGLSTSVSIGGGGGSGGPGGAVSIDNLDQVLTFGSNAPGLKVQSVGGGGGHGGAALATAFAISQVPEVPSLSVAVSIGGIGGSGNTAGSASVTNSGIVASGGHGAPAIIAQSVGGGGGFGGDASTSAVTGGGADFKVPASVAIGGKGGTGASGGVTTVENDGILATFGQNSPAIVAQSIGGGGGFGGAGDVSAQTNESKGRSFSASIAVGGAGGIGGAGQEVVVTNRGGIATRGDTSDSILAQSVGGGGGVGGGGAGKANNDQLSITVDVGGTGGSGNEAAYVQVQNFNTIVTSGLGSMGVTAQSIGGGDGRGGKGGATAGGAETAPDAPLTDALKNGLNSGQKVTTIEPGVVKIGPVSFDTGDIDPKNLLDFVTSRSSGDDSDDGDAKSLSVAVAVGGKAGAGGDGNAILLENSGQIVASGALANGLTAQSIGGGGGIGGAGTASTTNDNKLGFSLALGGRGGSAGDGGATTVNMKVGSSITTTGSGATGILAQSIGGGGGNATMSGAANQAGLFGGRSLGVTIGGNSGSSGTGGKVTVNHQGSFIQTDGKNAIGIIAQSIGGGGGLSHVISTDQIKKNSLNNIEDKFNLSLKFGGSGVKGGAADDVSVVLPGLATDSFAAVSTTGYLAHGILAQSIGGFGGAALGGKTDGINIFVPGSRSSAGAGGSIDVAIGRSVTTEGEGAYGILAQSIGGGGGLGGDFSARKYDPVFIPFNSAPQGIGYNGDGGAINVSLSKGLVKTEGGSAPAIFAQSLGGGGGHVGTDVGIMSGTFGGKGTGGPIHISVDGATKVIAMGSDSSGISAQSDGGSGGSPIRVDVGSLSSVQGGGGSAASIRFRGGSKDPSKPNIISNKGIIQPWYPGGIAVWVDSATTLINGGTLTGDLCGPVTGGSNKCFGLSPLADTIGSLNITNSASGIINTADDVILGSNGVIKNAGLISVGGAGNIMRTQMVGDLEQSETGRLEFDLDLANGRSDILDIDGAATLLGTLTLNPLSLAKRDATIVRATGGLQQKQTFDIDASHLFSFSTEVRGNELALITDADFGRAAGLSDRNKDLADHLQGIWNSVDTGFGVGFAALANIDTAEDYDAALNTLSGRATSAVAAARYESSLRLVNSAFSCPTFEGSSAHLTEESCVWMRVDGADFDRDASGDSIDYNGQSTIVTIGGQRELVPGWFLAAAIGYENSSISSVLGATDVDGKAGLGVLALKRQVGPWVIGGAFDLGYGTYDSRRNITFGDTALQARASSNAFNAGLHFNASFQKSYGAWYVEPQINLDMTYLRLDGYKETGADPFNLDVATSDNVIFSGTPSVKLGRRFDLGSGTTLNAFATAGVGFLSGNDWQTDARFLDAPSSSDGFETTLNTPDTLGRFGVGVEIYNQGGINLKAQYEADVASNYLSHRGELRLSLNF